jgi:processive 1,2-diacylglycerol beta-glucosyltransferase/1,2-diacylglycerol 3-beta-galactosyltransferase
MTQKLLLTYLNSGGGHLAGAKAVKAGIEAMFPGRAECELLNGFPERMRGARFLFEDMYAFSTTRFIWGYASLYELSRFKPIVAIEQFVTARRCATHIARAIRKHGITKIVNFHFILERACWEGIRLSGRDVKLATVVMDPFSVPPLWFGEKRQRFVVFSERARRAAIDAHGIDPSRVFVSPIVLKPQFERPLPADAIPSIKAEHGFDPARKLLLLAGGGDGLKGADRIVAEALRSGFDGEIAVVCGKNKALEWRVRQAVKRAGNPAHVKIYGFIDFMYELMNMADIVISKAGPATVMETLAIGKPLIISSYIYGQEKGNVDFAVRAGCAHYITDPAKIVAQATRLLADPEARGAMLRAIKALDIRNGLAPTCEHLLSL